MTTLNEDKETQSRIMDRIQFLGRGQNNRQQNQWIEGLDENQKSREKKKHKNKIFSNWKKNSTKIEALKTIIN